MTSFSLVGPSPNPSPKSPNPHTEWLIQIWEFWAIQTAETTKPHLRKICGIRANLKVLMVVFGGANTTQQKGDPAVREVLGA